MANDLTKMSKKQLEKLISDAQKALTALQAKEKREAKKAAEAAAAKFGFSLSQLTGAASKKSGRKSAPKNPGMPKYANPQDPEQTWTGKGRQPQWYKDAVAAGKDPKELEL